jgi:HAD superfamily hydrolase (TIGR01484 family)
LQSRRPIKLIGTDFDMTLVYNGIPQPTRDLLVEMVKRGIRVGIVSGRPWHDMRSMLTNLGIEFGRPYPNFLIGREKFILWVEEGKTREETAWNQLKMREMEALNFEIIRHAPVWLGRLRAARLEHRIWNIYGDYGFEVSYKTPEEAERARVILLGLAGRLRNAEVSRNYWGTNVTLATGSKGATLRHAAERLGIAPDEVLAIGDSLNDVSMLDGRYGLRSAAVANADPVVKKAVERSGGLIAENPGGDGVAEIIRKLVR